MSGKPESLSLLGLFWSCWHIMQLSVVMLMLMMTCAQLSKDGSDIEALLVVGETLHERRRPSFHKIWRNHRPVNVDTKVMMIRTWTLSDDYCSTVAVGFLDALASLDLKLSVSGWGMFFTASASTGLSELLFLEQKFWKWKWSQPFAPINSVVFVFIISAW